MKIALIFANLSEVCKESLTSRPNSASKAFILSKLQPCQLYVGCGFIWCSISTSNDATKIRPIGPVKLRSVKV